jgi:dolichol-phosphate mannosyltransferase
MRAGGIIHGTRDLSRLPELVAGLRGQGLTEILVVVDHEVPREQEPPGVSLVRNDGPLACGARQKAGYREALARGWDRVIVLRGDGSHAPSAAGRLLAELETADLAVGTRLLPTGGGLGSPRRVALRALSWGQRRLSGVGLSDFSSGYRAIRASALQQVTFESLSSDRTFDIELLLACAERGLVLAEVEIHGSSGLSAAASATSALRGLSVGARSLLARTRGVLGFPGPARPPLAPSVGSEAESPPRREARRLPTLD